MQSAVQSEKTKRDLVRKIEPESRQEARFGSLLEMIRARQSWLSTCLLEHGAILLRGFEVDGLDRFAEAVEALSGRSELLEYRGGASPRFMLSAARQPVYNSTEYPPQMELSLHNELSYSDVHPDRIYFFCHQAPGEGGETTLGDSRRILRNIAPDVRDRFEAKGVAYIRNLPSGRGSGYSWQDAFGTHDRDEVERRGARMSAKLEWLDGDILRVRQVRPAIAVHPRTGERVWFNQADGFHPSALDAPTYAALLEQCGSEEGFRLNVSYGDGAPIELSALREVRRAIREEAVPHLWQEGDILVLDNRLTAHGRRPYRGQRRIAVAMS